MDTGIRTLEHTLAFDYFSDILYWEVLHGVLTEEYGRERADYLINPYLFFEKENDHVFPSGEASTGEREDTVIYDFTFDIPEIVFSKIAERANSCHFVATEKWHAGLRTIRLKCSSREISQDWDSWKKFPEIANCES